MSDNEEVVMTPLLAPEGTTVLKVERVSRGVLDPRTVHYVAGGRYKGIIINRAAKERPDPRPPNVRRHFTCYIGAKIRGEPTREQRQLRFWYRRGSFDMEPMAERFFKELLNPHLFPRDYIGYVKRILQLLQGYPTVSKMELEMRPARPDEADQQYVVRRASRQCSQPPPGAQQDDYHTWHTGPRAGARGELTSTVERRLSTRSPSPGRSLCRPQPRTKAHYHSQEAILAPVTNSTMNRSWDGRRRYSIDSLDSAGLYSDFRGAIDSCRAYTSSPRIDRKGSREEPVNLNVILHQLLDQRFVYTNPPGSPTTKVYKPLQPETSTPSYTCCTHNMEPSPLVTAPHTQPVTSHMPTNKYRSIRVLTVAQAGVDRMTIRHVTQLTIPHQPTRRPQTLPRMTPKRQRSTAFIVLSSQSESPTESPTGSPIAPPTEQQAGPPTGPQTYTERVQHLTSPQSPETCHTHHLHLHSLAPEAEIEAEIAPEVSEDLTDNFTCRPPDQCADGVDQASTQSSQAIARHAVIDSDIDRNVDANGIDLNLDANDIDLNLDANDIENNLDGSEKDLNIDTSDIDFNKHVTDIDLNVAFDEIDLPEVDQKVHSSDIDLIDVDIIGETITAAYLYDVAYNKVDNCDARTNELSVSNVNVKDVDTNDVNVKDINTKDVNVKDIDTNDVSVKDMETNDVSVKEMDSYDTTVKDMNTNDINVKDMDTNDVIVKDMDTNDVNIKEMDSYDTTVKDMNTNDINVKDIDTNDIHVKDVGNVNIEDVKTYDVDIIINEETITNEAAILLSSDPNDTHNVNDDASLDELINELATQYELDDIDDAEQDPQSGATYRKHEETTYHAVNLTSRSPSPAHVAIRKLPPSPIVSRVKSSPVVIRRTSTQMPVVAMTHTRVLNAPIAPPAPPSHPGLSKRGVQVLWVARRYRVLKLLEDAYPNSVTAEELLRYYKLHAGRSTRLVDVVALTTILQWLSNRGLVREVEPGQWMRLETVRSTGHNKWTHVTQIVSELPTLPHLEMPQVAIVTLMYAEKLAVDAMIDNKKTYVWRRPHDKGEGQVITLGNIGQIRVVSTKLPKPGEGESSMLVARTATSRVIGSFTSVSRVLLVGVAGGIAHFTDDRRHIRRGDIVVCKPKQARAPMYIYCTGTERSVSGDYRFASRNWVTKDETLENLINSYQIRQRKDSNFCPWERYIQEGLVLLQGGDVDFRRPELSTDRLVRFGSDGRPHEVPHPAIRTKSARDLRPGQPMVHYDVIGGGEALMGDYNKRRTFAMLTGAKAIDIGYQPVLEAIEEAQKDSVAIIRGISDYNDGRSDSYWQPYSALVAAAFTKALLLELPIDK